MHTVMQNNTPVYFVFFTLHYFSIQLTFPPLHKRRRFVEIFFNSSGNFLSSFFCARNFETPQFFFEDWRCKRGKKKKKKNVENKYSEILYRRMIEVKCKSLVDVFICVEQIREYFFGR